MIKELKFDTTETGLYKMKACKWCSRIITPDIKDWKKKQFCDVNCREEFNDWTALRTAKNSSQYTKKSLYELLATLK